MKKSVAIMASLLAATGASAHEGAHLYPHGGESWPLLVAAVVAGVFLAITRRAR